jgi:hypothetical protein
MRTNCGRKFAVSAIHLQADKDFRGADNKIRPNFLSAPAKFPLPDPEIRSKFPTSPEISTETRLPADRLPSPRPKFAALVDLPAQDLETDRLEIPQGAHAIGYLPAASLRKGIQIIGFGLAEK